MKFAHKITNVQGGNRLVTVTEHKGKALTKVTLIPKGLARSYNLGFKEFVYLVESSHEKQLKDAIAKLEKKGE